MLSESSVPYTDEEIEQVIEGKDFWLGPEEFCERWEKRNKYMQALQEEVVAAALPVVKTKAKRVRKGRVKPA